MTQNQTKPLTGCTCASCPQFHDHRESNGRGWCNLFNRAAAQHHALTADCLLNLPSETDNESIPEEDKIHCKYEQGCIVKLIDSQKHYSQWETFVVVGQKYNSDRFRSDKAYLTEPDWFIYIASTNQLVPAPFWVAETDICSVDNAEFIDTAEVF